MPRVIKPLTHVSYITIHGDKRVPLQSLTEKEKEEIKRAMSKNLSKSMSLYYSQHMAEYVKL